MPRLNRRMTISQSPVCIDQITMAFVVGLYAQGNSYGDILRAAIDNLPIDAHYMCPDGALSATFPHTLISPQHDQRLIDYCNLTGRTRSEAVRDALALLMRETEVQIVKIRES